MLIYVYSIVILLVGGRRFELRNPKEQIYSLPRLTTSLSLHMLLGFIIKYPFEPITEPDGGNT